MLQSKKLTTKISSQTEFTMSRGLLAHNNKITRGTLTDHYQKAKLTTVHGIKIGNFPPLWSSKNPKIETNARENNVGQHKLCLKGKT